MVSSTAFFDAMSTPLYLVSFSDGFSAARTETRHLSRASLMTRVSRQRCSPAGAEAAAAAAGLLGFFSSSAFLTISRSCASSCSLTFFCLIALLCVTGREETAEGRTKQGGEKNVTSKDAGRQPCPPHSPPSVPPLQLPCHIPWGLSTFSHT